MSSGSGTLVKEKGFHRTNGDGDSKLIARYKDTLVQDFLWWAEVSDVRFDAHLIIERVWLGSVQAAVNTKALVQLDIKYALTVACDMVEFTANEDAAAAKTDGHTKQMTGFVEHAAVDVFDSDEDVILEHMEEALRYIDDCLADPRGGSVLVHCAAGVSRSATVVIAYLMTRQNMRMNEALTFVSGIRECASPNENFLDQLQELERCDGNVQKALEAHLKACDAD